MTWIFLGRFTCHEYFCDVIVFMTFYLTWIFFWHKSHFTWHKYFYVVNHILLDVNIFCMPYRKHIYYCNLEIYSANNMKNLFLSPLKNWKLNNFLFYIRPKEFSNRVHIWRKFLSYSFPPPMSSTETYIIEKFYRKIKTCINLLYTKH